MTALITNISAQRSSDLRRYAAERRRALRGRRGRPGRLPPRTSPGVWRSAPWTPPARTAPPWPAFASLDSGIAPTGASLGAELDGRLVAAVSIDGSTAVADPFAPTADVRALLELRAAQLRAA